MRWGALLLACVGFSTLLVGIRAEQKMPPQSRQWARQMAEYCEDLASSFERLESYHRTLAKQCRQARRGSWQNFTRDSPENTNKLPTNSERLGRLTSDWQKN